MSQKRLLSLKKDKIELFCHTNSKKDPWEIYGFISSKELELFEFLIGISRVGPKTALEASAILSLIHISLKKFFLIRKLYRG